MKEVTVMMGIESGCDPKIGEYGLSITHFTEPLDISSPGGVDDISLIKEAIENNLDFDALPPYGEIYITLIESGEMEDVFWHKYYEITGLKTGE